MSVRGAYSPLENICADITGDLTGALSELKLSNEERRLGKLLASSPLDTKKAGLPWGMCIFLRDAITTLKGSSDALRMFSSGTARALCLLAMTAYIKRRLALRRKTFQRGDKSFPLAPLSLTWSRVTRGCISGTWPMPGKSTKKALALKKK